MDYTYIGKVGTYCEERAFHFVSRLLGGSSKGRLPSIWKLGGSVGNEWYEGLKHIVSESPSPGAQDDGSFSESCRHAHKTS